MIRSLGLITAFITIIGGTLWGASLALTNVSERTVTYQFIADALDALSQRPSHVTWVQPTTDLIRPFTPGDEVLIGQAMTEAWYALTLAQSTGEIAILRDGFSGVAQERAEQSVSDAALGGQMVVLAQKARPQFYHLDGSVFQAEVGMHVARYMVDGDDLMYLEVVEDQAITTLMNESNGWRVYAHERHASTQLTQPAPGWNGAPMAGINYYPAQTPWRDFWSEYDPQTVAADFDRVVALGGTAVRIFLTTDDFAKVATQEKALRDLVSLLQIAEQVGLQVVPTLFDLKPTYDAAGWGQDYATLRAVLPILAMSPAVTLLDIKNEPDLDFEAHGRAQVLAWLTTMTTLAREQAPDLALTIGWSSADAALELESILDVVSYHDYADIDTASDRLAAVQMATERPVMITEIGVSSYGVIAGFPGSPTRQAAAIDRRMKSLANADGVFVWTLYDFPQVDASAVGGSPWVQRLQSQFGLLMPDGTAKPSADVVRSAFERMAPP